MAYPASVHWQYFHFDSYLGRFQSDLDDGECSGIARTVRIDKTSVLARDLSQPLSRFHGIVGTGICLPSSNPPSRTGSASGTTTSRSSSTCWRCRTPPPRSPPHGRTADPRARRTAPNLALIFSCAHKECGGVKKSAQVSLSNKSRFELTISLCEPRSFDMVHEFVYQFQSFCQFRSKNAGRPAEETQQLEAKPNVRLFWNSDGSLALVWSRGCSRTHVDRPNRRLDLGAEIYTALQENRTSPHSDVARRRTPPSGPPPRS